MGRKGQLKVRILELMDKYGIVNAAGVSSLTNGEIPTENAHACLYYNAFTSKTPVFEPAPSVAGGYRKRQTS